MEYTDIIKENCEKNSAVAWWPRFAFHYTDVTNAVSILSSGKLYSRANATELNIMKNDNANRQVIDMTQLSTLSKVRFYFRPLTPTQYFNEGYKHPLLRYDGDENANIPVPVFLLFDLAGLLSLPGVQFSEKPQAGRGAEMLSGVEAFSKLDFEKIYDNTSERGEETRPYRHAEIVHANEMKIEPHIKRIVCRNDIDRMTLLNLLSAENPKAYYKYKDIVRVHREDIFYENGLYVSECLYHNNSLSLSFADTYGMKRYIEKEMAKRELQELPHIKVRLKLQWFNAKTVCHEVSMETESDIIKSAGVVVSELPKVDKAKSLRITAYFDDKLACCIEKPLDGVEVC